MRTLSLLLALVAGQDAARPLPTRAKVRSVVAFKSWARDLRQIPSTVIDVGVLRDIPYTSYRSGGYEVNVYGDPAAPCCVEVGIHGDLLSKPEAKKDCLGLMNSLFEDPEDRKLLAALKLDVDKQERKGLTFEVTPPTAEDAYGGWWISVYDEPLLDASRATKEELKAISTTREDVKKAEAAKTENPLPVDPETEGKWSGGDLEKARKLKDVPEEKQKVYAPSYTRKNGKYVPDRSEDDTGYILFICANSGKHEDMEVILKTCPSCSKESTFFWDTERKCFICFKCGEGYDNALVKCPTCGTPPRRVRTKHR